MSAYRVMVVAEDRSLRSMLVSLLEEWQFQAFPAVDNLDALRQVYQVSPQIVVTDIELTNFAGFEWLPFLRRRFPEMGVVAVTRNPAYGAGNPHAGVTDQIVVIDPLDRESLRKVLLELGASFPLRQEFKRNNSSSTSNGSTLEVKFAPSTRTAWTMS